MENYNKIIESLNVKIAKAKNIGVAKNVTVTDFFDITNTIILVNQGEIVFGDEDTVAKEGDILFVPNNASTQITYGNKQKSVEVSNDELHKNLETYFAYENINAYDNFSYITLNTKVFDSVNFFQSLDIPPFVIPQHKKMEKLVRSIIEEQLQSNIGKDRVISLLADQLIIEVIRYIDKNNLFVEQIATNTSYLKDPRLLDLFGYIRENLSDDLSNKALAKIANVSEDYVGQYFKMLTGINPQDYIEYQRMEKAVHLLRTSKQSIKDIGQEVGYKDTAYFCRRFKMMFGISAGKMRKRESLMNL
ncbi:MAG: helix-turn-helix transcriptional regulator [Cytophagales bacterium]|nr:helix-turn-helix transcriptional regulator [Cytophagales bacterium]